jgi:hypothetical protein
MLAPPEQSAGADYASALLPLCAREDAMDDYPKLLDSRENCTMVSAWNKAGW